MVILSRGKCSEGNKMEGRKQLRGGSLPLLAGPGEASVEGVTFKQAPEDEKAEDRKCKARGGVEPGCQVRCCIPWLRAHKRGARNIPGRKGRRKAGRRRGKVSSSSKVLNKHIFLSHSLLFTEGGLLAGQNHLARSLAPGKQNAIHHGQMPSLMASSRPAPHPLLALPTLPSSARVASGRHPATPVPL